MYIFCICPRNYGHNCIRTFPPSLIVISMVSKIRPLLSFDQISDNQDSLDMDPQEHSFTRTIDEEAELEERVDREREEGHQEQDDEEDDREHEVMTAGSKYSCL